MGTGTSPNILWIVSEDCPPWLGAYGDALAATPNLDALAERGTLFERAYSAAPVCSPARFGMLTGVAPESHSPADRMRSAAERPSWMRTYPELLREHGYYCTNNAKTDYNLDVDAHSLWDDSSTAAHWRNRPDGSPFLAVFNFDATHESALFGAESALSQAISQFAPQMVSTFEPAVPLDEVRLPAYLPDTEEIRADFARYYAAIVQMDAFVGRLIDELRDDGLEGDTVILYTSDHGGVTPRSKRYCYEEGLHVPLIVAAPPRFAGEFPPGARTGSPVTTLSIVPTVYALADIDCPAHVQQPPLGDFVADDESYAFGGRNRMDERFDLVRTVRSKRYRYLRNYTPHRPVIQHQAFAWNAAGYQSWEREHDAGRLNPAQGQWWQPKPAVELYDLDADPDEVNNLAGRVELADVEAELRRRLRERTLEVNDNGFLADDSAQLGYDNSRVPGAYPLAEVLDLADAGLERDVRHTARFVAALESPDPTIRRWGAIGLLGLAPAIAGAEDALRRAAEDAVASVSIPAAEALARTGNDPAAYEVIARWAGDGEDVGVRLEAVNALSYLDPELVRHHREVVDAAAEHPSEYLRSAGRYLALTLDGSYTPSSPVYSLGGDILALMRTAQIAG
ncbi:arylsulfatase A-like enzyme [Microterricola gilva]|uniref:Arylsulfatase A-like enzyme n=1 Tax=Microterricola gilva TaxID=393267 RepID=A0A4Q8AQU9_9MICO|nr:sulfatase [Microterricola gilva]RZU67047.1 arylsulfatase A-like enzyme [Microterricola gilva]